MFYSKTVTILIFFLRLVLACICGGAIGIERQRRIKVAGTRTHMVVALAAALMMIVSKYGFMDVMGVSGASWDVSRVAAGIITGIGILGGGIIFIGRQGYVSGITTAVGIWATIGIGMALGAGMYAMGLGATAIMLLIQWFLHKNLWVVKQSTRVQVCFRLPRGLEDYEKLMEKIDSYQMTLYQIKWDKKSSTGPSMRCFAIVPAKYGRDEIIKMFIVMDEVESFELV
ncbi:MAG: MgtC/SapB family protein [Eubacterium sp.]|nr:MgtC/SapB family protein [Eubacterium sp.]MCM1214508.1 MgtC/SapB family protein [Lachnospiraceae bacterium]MCM1303553.1 MgtC/SapB family protein [Butyrivibrio sp.]MCM1343277.1 MgtC/SapB family protein [Muribaculaceae bacterium]MCM1238387.1 MgtC/SapB family protein [Lachnospiraceae bacterium]